MLFIHQISSMKQNTEDKRKRAFLQRNYKASELHSTPFSMNANQILKSSLLTVGDSDTCTNEKSFYRQYPQKVIQNQLELQKLVQRIGDQNNEYHNSGRIQRYKSQQEFKDNLSSYKSSYKKPTLKPIIQTPEEFRKDIFTNQGIKSKASLQAAVAKRHIQYAHKEIQANSAERNHLKSDNALYQKEIMIVKDNFDRLKQKYQIDLFHCNNQLQLQRSKNTINELQAVNKELKSKVDSFSTIELALTNSESSQQYQRLRGEFLATVEKSQATERKYNDLFENYKRMEVFCQSLQRQIGITKSYLQKQLQIRNTALLSKSNEVTLLSKKVQQTTLYLQARDKAINELQSLISEERRKLQTNQLERARLNGQNTILSKRIAELQSQNHMYQQHIKSLSVSYKKQQQQLNSNENQLQNCYKDWQNFLKTKIMSISTDTKLQNQNKQQNKADGLQIILQYIKKIYKIHSQHALNYQDIISKLKNHEQKIVELKLIIRNKQKDIKSVQKLINIYKDQMQNKNQLISKSESLLDQLKIIILNYMDQVQSLKNSCNKLILTIQVLEKQHQNDQCCLMQKQQIITQQKYLQSRQNKQTVDPIAQVLLPGPASNHLHQKNLIQIKQNLQNSKQLSKNKNNASKLQLHQSNGTGSMKRQILVEQQGCVPEKK